MKEGFYMNNSLGDLVRINQVLIMVNLTRRLDHLFLRQ